MGVRTKVFREEMSRYIFNITASTFGRVVLLGALVGAITWLLALALERYMLTPFFCGGEDSVALCLNSTVVASNIAAVLVGVMTVPLLAMISMKRALLVVSAAVVALWGVAAWVAGPWYVSLLWTIAAYAAVYAVLTWINRLRGDISAIIFVVLFVVLARVALSI